MTADVQTAQVSELLAVYNSQRQDGSSLRKAVQAVIVASEKSCNSAEVAQAIDLGAAMKWWVNAMPPGGCGDGTALSGVVVPLVDDQQDHEVAICPS